MSAPGGVVDLSLPDYDALLAAAGVNPDEEAARVAGAAPQTVSGSGAAFARAGGELDASWARSMRAQATVGAAFVNDGASVLDHDTHVRNLPAGFRDAGTGLAAASNRLVAVADELIGTMTDTAATVTGLHGDLQRIRTGWAARVAAAATLPGGLIPEAALPSLLAERDGVAADMAGRVGDAGRRVTERIRGYEAVVNDALRLLADQGFVPPEDLDAPPPAAPRLAGGTDPVGLGTPVMAGYAADPVNTAIGNFVEVELDLPVAGPSAGLAFARTYNSCSDRIGPFGPRWSSWASTRLVDRTWTAEYEGPDGQRVHFPRVGTGFGRTAGIDALVERTVTGLELAWFDGRRWTFDPAGRLVRTWAGPGTAVVLRYDESDRLVELVHERGRQVLLDWTDDGDRIRAVVGSDGRRVDYRYDGTGQLTEVDTPAGARRYRIDEAGLIASVTDADGVIELVNTYDDEGRVRTQLSPFGRLVTFGYHPDGTTVVADDSAGPRNTYRHDRAGRLLAATDGHGNTQHKRYDRWGNPIEIVERGGAVTRQEFDERAHLIRRTLSSGAVVTCTWDDADRITSITTSGPRIPLGVTLFGYRSAERHPSEIIDPEGGVTRFEVADGLVTAVTDADGVGLRFRHDQDGNPIEARDAAGGVARLERDPTGRVTAVTSPAGRRIELRYDAHGRLVERRDPAGGEWRYEYSVAGRPTAITDPTGARTETRYGRHGEAAESVDALGAPRTARYDALGNLADLITADGRKWSFGYDALCRLTACTDPAGGQWLHEHDPDGRRTATLDPTGRRESFGYDPSGRVALVHDGLAATRFTHDELGRPIQQQHPDDTTCRAAYDRCGRRVTAVDEDGGVTRYEYTSGGRLSRIVSPAGRIESFDYDECGRLVTRTDGNGRRWRHRYDPDGLLVETCTPAGLIETIFRDAAGRVCEHRVPGHGTVRYRYDPVGRIVEVVDRAGCRRFTRDLAGRVVAATDALGHTTRYTWDERGDLVTVTDPLGAETRREYDELGRLTAEIDPLGRRTRLRYDAAGRLLERRDDTGAEVRFGYDPAGRAVHVEAGDLDVRIERDRLGRTIRVDETGAPPVELTWSRGGRLVARRAGGRTLGWSYDADGCRTGLAYSDGSRRRYRLDGAGRVVEIEHPLLGVVGVERDPDGRLLALTRADGSTRFAYSEGWLTGQQTSGPGRARRTRLTRDDHGRIVVVETDGRRRVFGYDRAGQLVEAADADGAHGFRYDPAGRLTAENGPRGPREYRYDATGQLQTVADVDGERRFRYDEAGRRRTEAGPHGRRDYAWDALGRLRGITTAHDGRTHTTTLSVDALGELAAVDGLPLAWDSPDPAQPLLAVGTQPVPNPLAVDPLQADVLGVDRSADPWGSAGAGPAPGYRGELTVGGLIWLRHRVYDPGTRGFLHPDPLPAVPGTAYAGHPYHYAGNDPVNQLDPLGLRPITDAALAAQRDQPDSWWETLLPGALALAPPFLIGAGIDLKGRLAERFRELNDGRAAAARAAADDLRRARRSGNPARRALGNAPDARARIRAHGAAADDFLARAARFGRLARAAPFVGAAADVALGIYDITNGKSPSSAVVNTAFSIGGALAAGALLASAPVSVPVLVGAAGVAAVGVGVGAAAEWGWNQLPQGFRDDVDQTLTDGFNWTKDRVSDIGESVGDAVGSGWDTVEGWF